MGFPTFLLWVALGCLWSSWGAFWSSLGSLRDHFGPPWGAFGSSWGCGGALWATFGCLWKLLGVWGVTLGRLGGHVAESTVKINEFARFGILPRIRCIRGSGVSNRGSDRPCIPRAPGVRMTRVKQTPSNYVTRP